MLIKSNTIYSRIANTIKNFMLKQNENKVNQRLIIPENVTVIKSSSLKNCDREIIRILSKERVIIEKPPLWLKYEVFNLETAKDLLKEGVINPITVYRDTGEKIFLKKINDCFIKVENDNSVLVGVQNSELTDELIIPEEINIIGVNALENCKSSHIYFKHRGKMNINGSVPNTKYTVFGNDTLQQLIALKVTSPICDENNGMIIKAITTNKAALVDLDRKALDNFKTKFIFLLNKILINWLKRKIKFWHQKAKHLITGNVIQIKKCSDCDRQIITISIKKPREIFKKIINDSMVDLSFLQVDLIVDNLQSYEDDELNINDLICVKGKFEFFLNEESKIFLGFKAKKINNLSTNKELVILKNRKSGHCESSLNSSKQSSKV